jgi:hypothetical protein
MDNLLEADFWPAGLFYLVQLPICRHQVPFVVRAWSARAAHMAALLTRDQCRGFCSTSAGSPRTLVERIP